MTDRREYERAWLRDRAAELAGIEAFRMGVEKIANPMAEDEHLAKYWVKGWERAEEEHQLERSEAIRQQGYEAGETPNPYPAPDAPPTSDEYLLSDHFNWLDGWYANKGMGRP